MKKRSQNIKSEIFYDVKKEQLNLSYSVDLHVFDACDERNRWKYCWYNFNTLAYLYHKITKVSMRSRRISLLARPPFESCDENGGGANWFLRTRPRPRRLIEITLQHENSFPLLLYYHVRIPTSRHYAVHSTARNEMQPAAYIIPSKVRRNYFSFQPSFLHL